MRARLLVIAAALSVLAMTTTAAAQSRRALPTPKYTKILELDSTGIAAPALSPDGRWIVYSAGSGMRGMRNIWIIPSAGGTPRQLTTGSYDDGSPVWFPKGDRLVFSSTRVDGALMTIGLDPVAGRATDAPQRLTLEGGANQYAVSPDARLVVYQMRPDQRGGLLRIVPAAGGTARTLDSLPPGHGGFVSPTFTKDGRFVEYVRIDGPDWRLPETMMRVSVDGGAPMTIMRGAPGMLLRAANGVVASLQPGRNSVWLQSYSGDTIGTFTLDHIMAGSPPEALTFTSQSNTLLAVTRRRSWEYRILSTDGGATRAVRKADPADYSGGFLADGQLLLESRAGNRAAVDIVSPSGALVKRVVLPDSAYVSYMTNDGKLIYWFNGMVRSVYDVATGTSRVISRNSDGSGSDYKRFTSSRDEDLYKERVGDKIELRAWSPVTKTSRVLRTIAAEQSTNVGDYTARGDLVAYSVSAGDSTVVFVAGSPSAAAQRVIATRGGHTGGLSLSRDGRHLAVGTRVINGKDTSDAITFADLTAAGALTGRPRFVQVENPRGLTWLPSGTEILYFRFNRGGGTSLVRLGAEEGAKSTVITQNEPRSFFYFSVSLDGKWVVYPAELPNPFTIWRVDFPTPW